jgi:23S rRNA (pseudouridine1915-N3)-methyltransferase
MQLHVLAVGRLKERWWQEAAAEYLERSRPYATLRVTEVPDRDLAQGVERALEKEGEDILAVIPERAWVIALDRAGRERSSEDLAADLSDLGLRGRPIVAFVIGGSGGLSPQVLARADARLSLGAITLPHQLARVVLLEQLYRAFKIQRNEPYHR